MSQFHLLNRSRQITDYSCGASALRAVLNHWGKDVDEAQLMELLRTNSEIGTNPEDIASGARTLGFEAEVLENLTLGELAQITADGVPVIALAQVWRSEKDLSPLEDVWDNGHYVVVLYVDKTHVYFQDPFIQMSKAFVPRKTFEDHWHQVMGGELERNRKLIHLGIVVRGERSAQSTLPGSAKYAPFDYSEFGSLNLLVTQFDRYLLPFDFLDALQEIWKVGNVRPNAFIFLRRDSEGNLSGMEGSRLAEEDDIVTMNATMAAITELSLGTPDRINSSVLTAIKSAMEGDFGLPADELQRIAEKLPNNHSAIIVILENVWERKFKDVAKRYNGQVINQKLMTPGDIAKMANAAAS